MDPLPHQITAVYGEMLARQPLRFLLADDPGAGKTIMSGLLISSLLEKSIDNDFKNFQKKFVSEKTTPEDDNSLNIEDNNETNEIPPERDLRETQPTISVNYRVIKDNSENEITSKKKTSKNPNYQDDWNNKELEW